jgi:uncharacterized protein (TIGR02246 family)
MNDSAKAPRTTRLEALVLVLVGTLAIASCGCASASRASPQTLSVEPIELPPDLDRVLRDYERAWEAGDADGVAELFTEDGLALQNDRPPARGRDAIAARYEQASGPLRLEAISFAADREVATIVGRYGYGTAPASGKFVLALRREGAGPWRIAADIDNRTSSVPGPLDSHWTANETIRSKFQGMTRTERAAALPGLRETFVRELEAALPHVEEPLRASLDLLEGELAWFPTNQMAVPMIVALRKAPGGEVEVVGLDQWKLFELCPHAREYYWLRMNLASTGHR